MATTLVHMKEEVLQAAGKNYAICQVRFWHENSCLTFEMVRQYVLEMSWQGVWVCLSSRQDDCKIPQLFQMKKGFDECNLHPRQTSCSKLSSHKVSIIVLPYSLKLVWRFSGRLSPPVLTSDTKWMASLMEKKMMCWTDLSIPFLELLILLTGTFDNFVIRAMPILEQKRDVCRIRYVNTYAILSIF